MQLWVRFSYSAEAKEAEALLNSNLGGAPWVVQSSDRLARAQAYLGQSFHAEAIEELRKFLVADPQSPRRADAKLKLGIAQVRLKQYDQARETFRALVKEGDWSPWKGRSGLPAPIFGKGKVTSYWNSPARLRHLRSLRSRRARLPCSLGCGWKIRAGLTRH